MGKAALLFAFGAALLFAFGITSQNETEQYTAQEQADFEGGVVAREIARSGFNVAMGILREHGNDIHAAIADINRHGSGQKYLEGSHQGGTFRARAELVSGEVVRVTSVGYIGGSFVALASDEPERGWCRQRDPFSGEYYTGACHLMADLTGDSPIYDYELPSGDPLTAKLECSRLEVEFIESMAGYCSAVYLERTLPVSADGAEDAQANTPESPETLYVPGNNRDGQLLSISKYIRGGTQMNFFIGVDKDCSTRPTTIVSPDDFPAFTGSISDPAPYDHLHYALEEEVGTLGDMSETPWAFTEMHPDGIDESGPAATQRWRIGWEDQHITSWDNPGSSDPVQSLQALKRYGYDGVGWTSADNLGYRTLRDYGDRPDFSDQVIEVTLVEETNVSLCAPPEAPSEDEVEEPVVDCMCPNRSNDKKVAVWHKLPNQKTGRTICISENAVPSHLENHEDHIVCRGS